MGINSLSCAAEPAASRQGTHPSFAACCVCGYPVCLPRRTPEQG